MTRFVLIYRTVELQIPPKRRTETIPRVCKLNVRASTLNHTADKHFRVVTEFFRAIRIDNTPLTNSTGKDIFLVC